MNSLQTPIRNAAGASSPGTAADATAAAGLSSPFRTPVRSQQQRRQEQAMLASPTSEQRGQGVGLAFSPRGRWINPETQRVLDDRAQQPNERQSTMRLRWNVASLLVLAWCSQTGVYRQLKSVGLAAGIPLYVWGWIEWIGLAVLAYNIGEAVWYLLQPKKQYTDAAMTASQRLRVGLDSQVKTTGRGTPITAPRMTPSKASGGHTPGSVTDLDTRRRTPVKGSSAGGRNTTPRILRSPVSRNGAASQSKYSTEDDLLTLTQVLSKVPGQSSLTDNGPTTPTRIGDDFAPGAAMGMLGDLNLATPRLPTNRYGVNDMAVATPLHQHLRGQPPLGLYQTATPAARSGGGEGTKSVSKDGSSGEIDYLEPHEVLERYGVERDIFGWVENMHMWFVRHLLRPLNKQINELDALFEQHGLGHLTCRRAELDKAALAQAKNGQQGVFGSFGSTGFGGGFGTSMGGTNVLSHAPAAQTVPQTLAELATRYGGLPQTKERMALEKYLQIPGYSCREYIVQRVNTLAQSGALPAYLFDNGGWATGTEQMWNATEHPSDALLLFHLFCTFMDQTMPPVQNVRHPFTDRFVLQADFKPNTNLPVQIIQVARKRPHFCLVVKGAFYDIAAGRNNLFITLVLFMLEIQRECAGYLGLTNLGGKQVDLLSVIDK